jgi:hypothetical protein
MHADRRRVCHVFVTVSGTGVGQGCFERRLAPCDAVKPLPASRATSSDVRKRLNGDITGRNSRPSAVSPVPFIRVPQMRISIETRCSLDGRGHSADATLKKSRHSTLAAASPRVMPLWHQGHGGGCSFRLGSPIDLMRLTTCPSRMRKPHARGVSLCG